MENTAQEAPADLPAPTEPFAAELLTETVRGFGLAIGAGTAVLLLVGLVHVVASLAKGG